MVTFRSFSACLKKTLILNDKLTLVRHISFGRAKHSGYFTLQLLRQWWGGAEKVVFRDENPKITNGALSSILSLTIYGNNREKLAKFLFQVINK